MKMYTIGELSSLTSISATTLRYYDQEGILCPEVRNAANGYRYYSEKQLLQAQLIKELRGFGLGISDIQVVLEKQDANYLAEQLRLKAEALTKEAEELNHQLCCVRFAYQRLSEGCARLKSKEEGSEETPLYQVSIGQMPGSWILSTRYQSRIYADQLFCDRSLEIQSLREQSGLYAAGPMLGIFHDGYASQFTQENGDLELCIPVQIKDEDAEKHPNIRYMEPQLCISTVHVGHYNSSYRAYLVLLEWIESSDYRITGPPIESYLVDPLLTTDFNNFITRISFPVELKQEPAMVSEAEVDL